MGNDMDKKGILTVRMMGTISVEYEGEFFPIGTALTGKILQLFLILLYAGKKGVGREELLDAFYGNGEYANPSGSLRAAVFRLRRLLKEMLPEHEYICTEILKKQLKVLLQQEKKRSCATPAVCITGNSFLR